MRVVIAEDSVLLREGLARLLADGGVEVVAQVGDGPGLVAAVDAYRPDLAVVDVRMPPTHTDEGLRAALEVRERAPGTAILVLSQYVEERYAGDLLAGGAQGIGYRSRTGSPTSASSWPPSAGSATAAPPSTPRSSPSSSAAAAGPIPWPPSAPASSTSCP